MNTLTSDELSQLVEQYRTGLLHEFEFLLKLQLHPKMVTNMLNASAPPYRAVAKLKLEDLDPRVAPLGAE